MRVAFWNFDTETAAVIDDAFNTDATAMQFYQLTHQRQPNAGTFMGSASTAGDAIKAIENAWQFSFRNADTSITDFNGYIRRVFAEAHRNLTREGELQRVGDQVGNDL